MINTTVHEAFSRQTAACFSGHRTIPARDTPALRYRISAALQQAFTDGYKVFICGGARGFDTIAAQEVIRFRMRHHDIRLIIAVPCASQCWRWPDRDKTAYRSILAQADDVWILSETYYNGCMQYRNRFMVDHSSLCLCYLARFEGGTWNTVRYALHEGVPVKNLAMDNVVKNVLRENAWSCIYTSRSVYRNAGIVHLSHFRQKKIRKMNI